MRFDRKLGVLGGMGPHAALRFLEHLLESTPGARDEDHVHVFLDNNPRFPSRYTAFLGQDEGRLETALLQSFDLLRQAGAAAVAVPCNAVHFLYDRLCARCPLPWYHMPQLVSHYVSERARRPLICGAYVTIKSRVYEPYLPDAVHLPVAHYEPLFGLIETLKGGVATEQQSRRAIEPLLEQARQLRCDGILLACTELSLMDSPLATGGLTIFDSSRIYAQAVLNLEYRAEGTTALSQDAALAAR